MTTNLSTDARDSFAALLDATGYTYLLKKQYKHAIALFTEAINLNSLRPHFWRHRMLAYIGENMMVDALKDIDHCMALEGRTARMLLVRAKLNWKLGLRDRGNEDVSDAYKIDPSNEEVLLLWSLRKQTYPIRFLLMRDTYGTNPMKYTSEHARA